MDGGGGSGRSDRRRETPRRARIVCTLGPATASLERIIELVEAGMNVARLNMSHGDWDMHARLIELVREADRVVGRPVAIMADLQGPKIRLGTIKGGRALLTEGSKFVLDTDSAPGTARRASTSHQTLAEDVRAGDTLYIDDGRIELRVTRIDDSSVHTEVTVGGEISDRKGVNLPSARLKLPVLNDKDRADLENALHAGVDWIALSFVREARDAQIVRECMRHIGIMRPVVAKIETPQAVEDLAEIVEAFNGVMVARGDLGLETPLERLPAVQRLAIDLARDRGRPAIVATQMLDSMVNDPTPTRAEVADVATAIIDGADALMLSAETSVGKYPVRSVHQMRRIIEATEAEPRRHPFAVASTRQTSDSLAKAAINLAEELQAAALCAFTATGRTARSLARHRAGVPLLALTPRPDVVRALSLTWGVEAIYVPMIETMDEMIALAEKALISSARFQPGEKIILLAGSQMGNDKQTNLLRILEAKQ
jgi:pyruvate kinase